MKGPPIDAITIDAIQTAMLFLLAIALIYVIYRLETEICRGSGALHRVLSQQQEIMGSLERVWKRIDALEMRQGLNHDVETLSRMRRLLDSLGQALGPNSP